MFRPLDDIAVFEGKRADLRSRDETGMAVRLSSEPAVLGDINGVPLASSRDDPDNMPFRFYLDGLNAYLMPTRDGFRDRPDEMPEWGFFDLSGGWVEKTSIRPRVEFVVDSV